MKRAGELKPEVKIVPFHGQVELGWIGSEFLPSPVCFSGRFFVVTRRAGGVQLILDCDCLSSLSQGQTSS